MIKNDVMQQKETAHVEIYRMANISMLFVLSRPVVVVTGNMYNTYCTNGVRTVLAHGMDLIKNR